MPWVYYHPFKKQKQLKKDKRHQQASAVAFIASLPQHVPSLSIWEAVHAGDIQAVNYHLANAENVHAIANSIDRELGYSLLHAAIIDHPNLLDLQRILLHYGAEVDIYSGYNVQAIHSIPLYCTDPHDHMIMLLNYGANVNAVDGDCWTPLHYVARFTQWPMETMRTLVKHGAKLNAQDTNSKSPAFCLLANGDYSKELEWLIDNGASPYLSGLMLDSTTGMTKPGSLLVQAAKYCRVASLTLLLARFSWSDNHVRHAIQVAETQLQRPFKQSSEKTLDISVHHEKSDKTARATLQLLKLYQQDRASSPSLSNSKSFISRKISLKLLTRF
jgi:ankyrin repeat protein